MRKIIINNPSFNNLQNNFIKKRINEDDLESNETLLYDRLDLKKTVTKN